MKTLREVIALARLNDDIVFTIKNSNPMLSFLEVNDIINLGYQAAFKMWFHGVSRGVEEVLDMTVENETKMGKEGLKMCIIIAKRYYPNFDEDGDGYREIEENKEREQLEIEADNRLSNYAD